LENILENKRFFGFSGNESRECEETRGGEMKGLGKKKRKRLEKKKLNLLNYFGRIVYFLK